MTQCDEKGRYVRQDARFRHTVEPGGPWSPAPGRYHLYVSFACPWAHRTLIVRKLRGLEDVIGLSVVHYYRDHRGWRFTGTDGSTEDSVNGSEFLSELYLKADPGYRLRPTVPVLWDKEEGTIVNNQSVEIIRMMDVGFAGLGDPQVNFYPEALRPEIDGVIPHLYENVNNGVYRCGFAQSQEAYNEAVSGLFEALDHYEDVLSKQRYLCGDVITEADWCLFTTLLRFDLVYYGHFKCNVRHIWDYPNLQGYLRDLYQVPGVAQTCNLHHIKHHYYETHKFLNRSGIVPKGPVLDLEAPHGRG
jgi:putative glutathione S-transferase